MNDIVLVTVHTDTSQTFRARSARIADHAHNTRIPVTDSADFLRGLDETERKLFRSAHDGRKNVQTWAQDLRKSR